MSNEVVAYEEKVGALSVSDVRSQVNLIQHILKEVMKKDEHYGVIPGTGTKPSLLKAGAEKLCLTFRLDPQYEIEQKQEGVHLTVMSKCTLWHIPSGQRYGSGMGSCSTKESKYAYRQGQRKCPKCGAEAIIKGKDFKNDGKPTGWICFAKKNGCGTKFLDGDESIEKQQIGRIPNEDVADQYNTVLKMANKRSLVAAVLNATAASDIFTQDIEDMPQFTAKVVEKDTDWTQDIPGAGNRARGTDAAPQANQPPSPPPAAPAESAPPATIEGGVSLEQAMDLAERFSKLDTNAEKDFLKIAKIKQLDQLPAADFAEALDWIERRPAAVAKFRTKA